MSSDPSYHLGTERFTTHQPGELEQVSARHAYARSLTGRGVRVGIDDTIVDYTQTAEFGNRVRLRAADGAQLTNSHPFGDEASNPVDLCRASNICTILRRDSQGDEEAHDRWVQEIISRDRIADVVSSSGDADERQAPLRHPLNFHVAGLPKNRIRLG